MCIADKMPRRKIIRESIVQNDPNSTETNSTKQQTSIGSSNVPITGEDPTEVQSNFTFNLHACWLIIDLFFKFLYYNIPFVAENGGTRRGRGRTLLADLYNLNSVERVKVTRNSHGQPVGQEARLLAGYLGIIARNANMLPINYESWHNMPDSNKNQALSNIKVTKR